jgi:3-oxoacyl-[acyl-carrier-protein] synthase III
VPETPIRERRRAAPDERLSDYAARVGAPARERAGVGAEQLDLVIVTQDELTPNTAPLFADAAGAVVLGPADAGFTWGGGVIEWGGGHRG